MRNVFTLRFVQLAEICCNIFEEIERKNIKNPEEIIVQLIDENGKLHCGFGVPK